MTRRTASPSNSNASLTLRPNAHREISLKRHQGLDWRRVEPAGARVGFLSQNPIGDE